MASSPPRWLVGAALAACAAGAFLRFSNLPRKLFWLDEAWTSLRVAGFTQAEIERDLYDGRVVGREDLLRYQQVTPGHGLLTAALVHVHDDAPHAPGYFVLARIWAGVAGDEPGPLRALSGVFGLMAIGAAWALAREAFASGTAGLVAASLFAVSPFQVLYGQEARPYALVALSVLLSGLALLRAARIDSPGAWLGYAASLIFGLYTNVLFLLLVLAHAVFFGATWRLFTKRARVRFVAAVAASCLVFLPWLGVIWANREAVRAAAGWTGTRVLAGRLAAGMLDSLVATFADALEGPGAAFGGASLLVPVLAAWAIVRVARAFGRLAAAYTIAAFAVPLASLFLADLILGGVRTLYPRFMVAALTGLPILVAGAVSTVLLSPSARGAAAKALFALLLGLGVSGSWQSNRSPCWWNSFRCAETLDAAALVNAGPRPVFVAHADWWIPNALAFSHLLKPKVRVQLVRGGATPAVPADASDVFVATHADPRARTDGAFAGWRLEPAVSFWLFRRVD